MNAADLFCGAGGTSLGAHQAGAKIRFALNHWQVAVDTHSANFPQAKHVNSRLDAVHPSECPKIDLLFASPECTHHSRARGGKPTSDQQRAGAWDVLKWVEHHRPSFVVIENVREFEEWGAVGDDGRPMVSHRGKFFQAWVSAIRAAGYRVEWRVLNAANFGAATSRDRLFVIARKGNRAIRWPEPTHGKRTGGELPGLGLLPWRAAAEVIDWSIECPSVFARTKPLQDKTLARIEAGIRRFVGPFAVTLRSTSGPIGTGGTVRDIDRPVSTITSGGLHHGVAVPLVASTHFGGRYFPVESGPCPTIRCRNGALLAIPYMIPFFGERNGQSPRSHDASDPMPAVTSHGAGGVCFPYLVQTSHTGTTGRARYDIDANGPMRTIGTRQEFAVAVPFLADVNHGLDGHQHSRTNDIRCPLGTITNKRGKAVCAPLVLSYYSNGKAQPSESHPLGTVTTNDRFGLLVPAGGEADFTGRTDGERSLLAAMSELGVLDIGFRMLANHELAAAQGFTRDYVFHGNKSDVTRQIGNSVSPPVARAITEALSS